MENGFPGVKHITLEYIERLKSNLEANTHSGVATRIQKFISAQQFTSILSHCTEIIEQENTCVYLRPENPEETVVNVVGDGFVEMTGPFGTLLVTPLILACAEGDEDMTSLRQPW